MRVSECDGKREQQEQEQEQEAAAYLLVDVEVLEATEVVVAVDAEETHRAVELDDGVVGPGDVVRARDAGGGVDDRDDGLRAVGSDDRLAVEDLAAAKGGAREAGRRGGKVEDHRKVVALAHEVVVEHAGAGGGEEARRQQEAGAGADRDVVEVELGRGRRRADAEARARRLRGGDARADESRARNDHADAIAKVLDASRHLVLWRRWLVILLRQGGGSSLDELVRGARWRHGARAAPSSVAMETVENDQRKPQRERAREERRRTYCFRDSVW